MKAESRSCTRVGPNTNKEISQNQERNGRPLHPWRKALEATIEVNEPIAVEIDRMASDRAAGKVFYADSVERGQ